MFLTRIGPSAKAIVTGDMTQIDLPRNQRSGLGVGLKILENINKSTLAKTEPNPSTFKKRGLNFTGVKV
jgi:phosphate starvation-inducible protein PhoH